MEAIIIFDRIARELNTPGFNTEKPVPFLKYLIETFDSIEIDPEGTDQWGKEYSLTKHLPDGHVIVYRTYHDTIFLDGGKWTARAFIEFEHNDIEQKISSSNLF